MKILFLRSIWAFLVFGSLVVGATTTKQFVGVTVSGQVGVYAPEPPDPSNAVDLSVTTFYNDRFVYTLTDSSVQYFNLSPTTLQLEVGKVYPFLATGDVYSLAVDLTVPGACYYVEANGLRHEVNIENKIRLPGSPSSYNFVLKNDSGGIVFDVGASDGLPKLRADSKSRTRASAPGASGAVTWSIKAPSLGCKINSTGDITAGFESGVITIMAAAQNCTFEGQLELVECLPCDSCDVIGSGSQTISDKNELDARWALGQSNIGGEASFLQIRTAAPSGNLAKPDGLSLPINRSGVEVIRSTNSIRQIKTAQGLADIQPQGAYRYEIKFYDATNVLSKADQLYGLSGLPRVTWTIANPDGATANNRLSITNTIGSISSSQTYIYASGQWTLEESTGLRKIVSPAQGANPRIAVNEVYQGSTLLARTARKYQSFSWGEGLIEETAGTTASPLLVTSYQYYDPGYGNNSVKEIVNPSGYWEKFQYDSQGRLTNKVAQLFDNAKSSADLANRVTVYLYGSPAGSPDSSTNQPNTARAIIEKFQDQEIRRTYNIFVSANEEREIRCQAVGALWDNTNNLVTISKTYATNFIDQIQSIKYPDGTMRLFQYAYNADKTQRTNTVSLGEPDANEANILRGTKIITVLGAAAEVLSKESIDIASQVTIDKELVAYTDSASSSYRVTYLDGTYRDVNSGCCGATTKSETDRENNTIEHILDALGREVALKQTRFNITATNVLDGAGNILEKRRISGAGQITLEKSTYDLAGRPLSVTNVLQGTTTNTYTATTTTQTFADLGTRTETIYQDGSTKRITGNAVAPIQFEYGIDSSGVYVKQTKLDASYNLTGEWVKTHTDSIGRTYKNVYPDSAYAQSYYNSKGQLWKERDPDGVVTLFAYNNQGELETTAIDLDRDDTIDLGGIGATDRVTQLVAGVVTNALMGANVKRLSTWKWTTDGSSSTNLARQIDTSVNGLKLWTTLAGVTAKHETTFDQTNGYRLVYQYLPNNAFAIRTNRYGRMESATQRDATGAQISRRIFAYDSHGRIWQETDARNGTTTYTYRTGTDLPESITTPAPAGHSAQTTTFQYDTSLRVYEKLHPDGKITSYLYYPTGLLKQESGAHTFPAGYSYDAHGRIRTMTNWTTFSSAGARVTSWNYHSSRNWLLNTRYPDNLGPDYTYKPSGRLDKRTWQRVKPSPGGRFETTYAYNNAGDIGTVSYGDGNLTPGLTQTYDRRGRMATVARGSSGGTASISYNDADQLTNESYSGGPLDTLSVDQTYTNLQPHTLTAKRSSTNIYSVSNSYDNALRLQQVTDGVYSSDYAYHPNSFLVNTITSKQNGGIRLTATKDFDALNRLKSITSLFASSAQSSYTYDGANRRTNVTLADGSYWVNDFDDRDQVQSGKRYWLSGTPVPGQQFEYAHDDIGNRTSTKAGGDSAGGSLRPASYFANSLNQYSSRAVPGTIDLLGIANGGALVKVNAQAANYRRNEYFHTPVTLTNTSAAVYADLKTTSMLNDSTVTNTGKIFLPPATEDFLDDTDGNLTEDGRWTSTWDSENRLMNVVAKVSGTLPSRIDFEYDHLGRRIKKTVTGNTTTTNLFLYNGWNLIAELDASKNSLRSYMWGNDMSGTGQGAGGVGGLLAVKPASAVAHFTVFDGNGNMTALIDGGTGQSSAQYEYGPFGEPIRVTGSMGKANPFRWSTKFTDDETDFVYYGHRYYNPATGKWLTRDPIGEFGGLNLYGFVGNNSMNSYDVLGLRCGDWWDPRTALHRSKGFAQGGWNQITSLGSALWNFSDTIDHVADAMVNHQETWDGIKVEVGKAVEKYIKSLASSAESVGVFRFR